MRFANQPFTDEIVTLDGNEYVGCHFERCRLTFSAVAPFEMKGCDGLGTCAIEFQGAAAMTLAYLGHFYRGGLSAFIEKLFDDIRAGTVPRF